MIKHSQYWVIAVVFFGLASLAQAASNATSYKKTLEGISGQSVEVEMPFPFIRLQSKEGAGARIFSDLQYSDGHSFNKQTIFVPEFFYAVIGKGLEAQSVVAGPLCPCVLVCVRHQGEDRAIILHSNGGGGLEGIVSAIHKEFGEKVDKKKLTFKFFTKGLSKEFQAKLGVSLEIQEENFKRLFLGLLRDFEVPLESCKEHCFYICQQEKNEREFYNIDRTVFVDKNLNFRSTTPINEQIFGLISTPSINEKYYNGVFYNKVLDFYLNSLFRDKKGRIINKSLVSVLMNNEKMPFLRIPDAQAGLQWLPMIGSGSVTSIQEFEELQQKTFVLTPLGEACLKYVN